MPSTTSELTTGNEIVRAGAGAGKTTELTSQVIQRAESFYEQKAQMPRMIVTTFTRKATQELRERLMVRALASGKPYLVDFVNSKAHLFVSTIHGVLELYLKRFGAPLAIDPNFKVLNRTEAAKLARKSLRQVLFNQFTYQDLLELFDFRKLTFLSRQYYEMKLRSQSAERHDLKSLQAALCALSAEYAERLSEVGESIKTEANGPKAEEWIEFANKLLAASELLQKASKNSQAWEVIRTELLAVLNAAQKPRANAKNPAVSEESSELAKELLPEVLEFVEENDPESLVAFADAFERFERLAKDFSEQFAKMKRDQGAIEISDLELLAGECIRLQPQSAQAFSKEWDHWLIDEYQDTSPFQVELLAQLVGERPVFIVGDPQQSIYLFRGARAEVFSRKEEEISARNGKLRVLDKNYRSRRELLSFFNDFFGSGFMPMLSFQEKALKKTDPVATFFVAQKQEKEKEPRDNELEGLVTHIVSQLSAGAKPDSICVLARTRATLVKIADLLDAAGVPVHLHASGGFYERREIQDALALLKFLVNPHDNQNLLVLLRSPWFRVGDDALVHAIKNVQESYWTVLSQIETSEFESVQTLKSYVQKRTSLGVSAVFRQAIIEAGFIDAARVHDSSGRRESNLWKLLSRLSFEEANPGFNPLQFILNTYAELRDFDGSEESDAVTAVEPNRVNLMTIHASKGLAFDHVVLPRLHERPRLSTHAEFLFDEDLKRWSMRVPIGVEQKFQGSVAEQIYLQRFQQQELQEHKRVLYVALTRARHSVFMSWTEPAQKNSWLEQIRFDLSDGPHHTEEYSYLVTREIKGPSKLDKPLEQEKVPRPPWKERESARTLRQVSVTQILDSNSRLKFGGVNFMKKISSSSYGTAVHKLMETIKYHSESSQISKLIAQWFPDKINEVTKAVEWMGAQSKPPITELIRSGEVEWSFAFKEAGRLVEGQIDLWGNVGGTIWIVDYKTGSPEMYEKAFSQMALYSLALRRSGQVGDTESILLVAVYPFAEKTFVKEAPSAAEVSKMFFSSEAL